MKKEEARQVKVNLRQKLYMFGSGYVIEHEKDVMSFIWECLMFDERDEKGRIEKEELKTKSRRSSIGLKLMQAYNTKSGVYIYEKDSEDEDEIQEILKRMETTTSNEIYSQIKQYLLGRENPLQSLFKQIGVPTYELDNHNIQRLFEEETKNIKDVFIRILGVLTPAQIEKTMLIKQFFKRS